MNSDNWLFHFVAPLALQCSPKWASQQPQEPCAASPFPKAPVLLQTPTLSSWAGEPLTAPGSRAGLSHGGTCKTSRGVMAAPTWFHLQGEHQAPLLGHRAVAQQGQTHRWQEGLLQHCTGHPLSSCQGVVMLWEPHIPSTQGKEG